MSERIPDERASAIARYKMGSENEPGQETRDLAADLLDARAALAAKDAEIAMCKRTIDALIARISELAGDCSRCGDHFHLSDECPL